MNFRGYYGCIRRREDVLFRVEVRRLFSKLSKIGLDEFGI